MSDVITYSFSHLFPNGFSERLPRAGEGTNESESISHYQGKKATKSREWMNPQIDIVYGFQSIRRAITSHHSRRDFSVLYWSFFGDWSTECSLHELQMTTVVFAEMYEELQQRTLMKPESVSPLPRKFRTTKMSCT
jgi:hypothetical protein